jgi:peroxin-4
MLRDAQRILRELRKAKNDNNDDLWLKTKEDNIRNWIGVLKAPADSPFAGHYYHISIHIPDGYPIDAPKAKFITPIFHPNVHFKKGKICLDILKTEWTPAWSIQSLCTAVALLLSHPAPDSPLNVLAGNLLRIGDVVGYRSMASMYADKFAPTKNELFEAEQSSPGVTK